MTARLREARQSRDWTQAELISRLLAAVERLGLQPRSATSLKTLVSMHENGRRAVTSEYQQLYCEVYEAEPAELGFAAHSTEVDLSTAQPTLILPSQRQLPTPANPDTLGYLDSILNQHAQAEPLVGPQFLLPAVQSQMPLIDMLVRNAAGALRDDVLRVGARYSEFIGWLYQDTGHTVDAAKWTGLAMELAQELGDPQLSAHILQRRSNIATEAGHAGQGAGLANAALRFSDEITPRLRASALRQLANSKAVLGEESDYKRAVEQAMIEAAAGDDSDMLAGYCSVAYVEMESATGAVRLGDPEPAVATYRVSLEHWPAVQVRDRGLCLARLATAHAQLGDVEGAYEAGAEAASIAQRTGSARIMDELFRLQGHLAPWSKLVEIADLNSTLDEMKGIKRPT
ncbi:helix-turn-helix transcriptional regulator [Streptomyces sp. TRM66268-LWL]|uniref:Helix-turn-helix transcriptional regulator n=1 Tax=Streptomyces polyasparticus TaxID=2767826 RepID=A0ABR7SN38_9ACTN|nr:helix-turn-helix transcriptional regulator [Streptomyces polyasparticus]MBC9716900.1 helix-turn-helix transcriptional regulator [Streptomyces polyasparticus]